MQEYSDRLLVTKYLIPTAKFCFSSYGFFAVNFIASIFLARLISPEFFGIFALLLGVREVLSQFAGFSRAQGYILSDGDEEDFSIAISLSAIASVLNLSIGIACFWLVTLLGKAEYAAILFWLFFGQAIVSVASIYAAPLEKQLSYVKLSIVKNAPNSFGLFAAIVTAIYVPSIWCLLLKELIAGASALCLAFMYFQQKPKFILSISSYAIQATFNLKFTASRLCEVFYMRLPEILLPVVFGPFFSGICFQSRHFSFLAVKVPNTFLEQTLFSSLVSLKNDNLGSTKYAALMAIFGGRVALLVLIPLLLNIDTLVHLTLGKQWMKIGEVFQYFAIFAFFMTQFNAVQAWQLSLGSTKGISLAYLYGAVCLAILILLSYFFDNEIFALIGVSISMALAFLILCVYTKNKIFTAILLVSCISPVATILFCVHAPAIFPIAHALHEVALTLISCAVFGYCSMLEFKMYKNSKLRW